MYKILNIIALIFFIFIMSCDNSTSSKKEEYEKLGEIEFVALNEDISSSNYTEETTLVRKTFDIETTNILDIDRIFSLPIEVDTSIYESYVSLNNVDSGGVLIIQNDKYIFDDGWYNPLAKKSDNNDIVSMVYFFTTIKSLHRREAMKFRLWFYKKDGTAELVPYIIENSEQYYISADDASQLITLEDITTDYEINYKEIKALDMRFILDSEELYKNYLVIHVNKVFDDSPYKWIWATTNAYLTRDRMIRARYSIQGELSGFENYTFYFSTIGSFISGE